MINPKSSFHKHLLAIGLLLLMLPSLAQQWRKKPDVAITNVNIIDVESGSVQSGMDVLITADRILEVRETSTEGLETARVIDGSGKYLIPGLWDMHAHPDDPEMWRMKPNETGRDLLMPLFVLHGVTGIRDMAGSLKVIKTWREKMANASLLSPVIYAAGPLIDGPDPMWDGSIGIPNTKLVPQKVDKLVEDGVDFLKIYSLLPDSIFFSLAEYARANDIPFCGHVPQTVTNAQASNAGMKSLEHLLDIPLEVSSAEERVRNRTIDYGPIDDRLGRYVYRTQLIIDTYDQKKADKLYQLFVKNDTWITPTISLWYKNAYFETEVKEDQKYFKYLPKYMVRYWKPEVNDHLKFRQPEFLEIQKKMVDHYSRIIGDMHKVGVKLLAGTDTGANPLCWPGLGVHLELEMFEKAGLSPTEALKTATINPVKYLGVEEDYGTIKKGKFADMVLLTENPLESISNTQKIFAVIKGGSFYSKGRIKEFLEEIAERQ